MSDILSQAEIEALLSSLQSEDGDGGPGASGGGSQLALGGFGSSKLGARGGIAYEVYDFRRPDKLSKDQLRTLQMLHETFARQAGTAISAFLRSPVSIELISLEQVPYEEYLRSINQSVFTIVSLPPLTGQAVIEMEFAMVFSMIDKLLGGPGRTVDRTVLTDIERPLIRQIVEKTFTAFRSAWEGVVVVNPSVDGMEVSAQFVQIAPPTDIVVTILFEVRVGEFRGAMSLCIPYLVLKPVTPKLSAQKWFVNSSRKHNARSRKVLAWQIGQAKVDCAIMLGSTRVNIKDFLKLRAGDVLRLDKKLEEDIELLVGNTPKFAGRPVLDGKNMVMHISHEIKEE